MESAAAAFDAANPGPVADPWALWKRRNEELDQVRQKYRKKRREWVAVMPEDLMGLSPKDRHGDWFSIPGVGTTNNRVPAFGHYTDNLREEKEKNMKIGFYRGDRMDIFRDGFDESKIEAILETDKEVSISDVLRINGKTYCVCRINHKHGFAEIDEIQVGEGEDKDFEDEITCPYCGHVHSDSYEYSDSEDEQECGQCGGVFSYERHVEVTYSSQPVKAPEIKSF